MNKDNYHLELNVVKPKANNNIINNITLYSSISYSKKTGEDIDVSFLLK